MQVASEEHQQRHTQRTRAGTVGATRSPPGAEITQAQRVQRRASLTGTRQRRLRRRWDGSVAPAVGYLHS
jgi:hypothetical protein